MQTLVKIIFCILISSTSAWACPPSAPEGFQSENKGEATIFVNREKTATIGLKCIPMEKEVSYKTLQYFGNRTVLDETFSYSTLGDEKDSTARLYFKVKGSELIQATVIFRHNSEKEKKALEDLIQNYLN